MVMSGYARSANPTYNPADDASTGTSRYTHHLPPLQQIFAPHTRRKMASA